MVKITRTFVFVTASLVIVAILISTVFFADQTHPAGTPPVYSIVNGDFTVDAESYEAFNFTTPTDISQIQVNGDFSVLGANPYGIRVFIWDTVSFTNFQSGHVSQSPLGQAISAYDSGLTTNGTIEASPYPGGMYFLIYQNNSTEPQNVTSQASFWYIQK
ncbi:MAG: hypothetical protein ABSA79_11205 [Candidatus Bathyarchaeia archaeon]|jgi:hypothetical protein